MIPIAFFLTPPLAGYTENFRNRLFQNYLLFYFSGFVLSQFIKHIAGRVAECGSDFWFLEPVHKLVPEKYLSKWSVSYTEVTKGTDVFDVWFDSGLSWLCTMDGKFTDLR
ncbi:Isoleucyl-tRNA synthetase [Fasciolopsis buskii]|uniref:Isoleucyl-tRNA synthetase n=1 Tax=Fasciolopsis buskii TaxID=27845 RepID=A0A8E0S3U9_9TREM|nr:Isoleucyl-tRNA synthetase [Fasciolopsis buski]